MSDGIEDTKTGATPEVINIQLSVNGLPALTLKLKKELIGEEPVTLRIFPSGLRSEAYVVNALWSEIDPGSIGTPLLKFERFQADAIAQVNNPVEAVL